MNSTKYAFELHTTTSQPMLITFDENVSLQECYERLINEIEFCTILHKAIILDIFAEDVLSNKTISLHPTQEYSIKEFVTSNRDFFPISPVTKNLYKLFVIDDIYLKKTASGIRTPIYEETQNKIKPIMWSDILTHTRSLIYL